MKWKFPKGLLKQPGNTKTTSSTENSPGKATMDTHHLSNYIPVFCDFRNKGITGNAHDPQIMLAASLIEHRRFNY
jgi:hypothetical protein